MGMKNHRFVPQAPRLIGVAGGSCSGKSTLAHAIAAMMEGSAAVVPMDAYYRSLAHLSLPERARFNFDAPEALEHELLVEHLRALKRGDTVEIPEYDFASHTRKATTRTICPAPLIIVEGLYALFWETLRALFDATVFIETPPGLCLERRIARDVRERGRTEASVRAQFAATVQPMYERFCAPTGPLAGIILPGDGRVEDIAERVMTHLCVSMDFTKEKDDGV